MSVRRQTEALDVPRGSLYPRLCKGVSEEELELMRLIDRHHTDEPTWGYRMITSHLREAHALVVNRKRVRRLMRDFTEVQFESVPREHPCIQVVDRLCNETLDARPQVKE